MKKVIYRRMSPVPPFVTRYFIITQGISCQSDSAAELTKHIQTSFVPHTTSAPLASTGLFQKFHKSYENRCVCCWRTGPKNTSNYIISSSKQNRSSSEDISELKGIGQAAKLEYTKFRPLKRTRKTGEEISQKCILEISQ